MKNLTNTIFRVLALAVVAVPMLTSCYDDSAILDRLDDIEFRLDSLENTLNEQLYALNTMVSAVDNKTTITSCDKNADGSYDVTLSNGAKFTVLPDGTDYSALVSVTTINGVKCWATYDKSGKLIALTNDAGQPVPVINDYKTKVEVLVEDGIYYLVIDGQKYQTGYDTEDMVQVFSSCEQLKDASGNVYAMQFTFGEGIKVTVAVDGYNGVIFRLPNMTGISEVLTEYYVANGDTQSILLEKAGVVDYIMQIPDGWRVSERVDEYTEETYIDITAPSVETIEAGAAVAEGELKVVAVVEGGKAAVSKLSLSTEPFKIFEVNGSKAVIEPYIGVQKYVYGVALKSQYDESSVLQTVGKLLKTTGDLPAGYAMADGAIDAAHVDTYGGNLTNNQVYVFWAIPALYNENSGYYVKEGMFHTYEFSNVTVKFNKVTPSLLDADLDITFSGTKNVYAGTIEKTTGFQTEIIRLITNGALTSVEVPESYKGPASAFPTADANKEVDFMPGTTYVSWIVPVEASGNYTANNLIYKEFTTKSITSGSSLKVTYGETAVDKTTISIPVSAKGAAMIYYLYMTKAESDRLSSLSNTDKAEYIFENKDSKVVKTDETTAVIEKVAPNTAMCLYAVAVDKDGKFGEVNIATATTSQLEYNSLTVTATDTDIKADAVSFKVEVSGGKATGLIYWFGKSTDDFWVNSKYLGGSQKTAQQYLALYPQDENITKCMAKYGEIASDGTITFTGLSKTTEYILVVSAKDESGKYSKAGYKLAITLAADLGNVVKEGSAAWNAAKGAITLNWLEDKFVKNQGMMSARYAFTYSGPTDLTAYIICASDDELDYVSSEVEERIIYIVDEASRYISPGETPTDAEGNPMNEPDWYDGEGNKHSGGMVNVANFYVHGTPSRGRATYFANGAHDTVCGNSEDGTCTNYQNAMDALQRLTSIDWYIDKFSGYYVMKGADEAIQVAAQALLEFYLPYYQDKKPIIYENDGTPIEFFQAYGSGINDKGVVVDDVFVVMMDNNGNYYEPMKFEVPNLF